MIDLIEEICKAISKSKHIKKVTIEGDITNIIIENPNETKETDKP